MGKGKENTPPPTIARSGSPYAAVSYAVFKDEDLHRRPQPQLQSPLQLQLPATNLDDGKRHKPGKKVTEEESRRNSEQEVEDKLKTFEGQGGGSERLDKEANSCPRRPRHSTASYIFHIDINAFQEGICKIIRIYTE